MLGSLSFRNVGQTLQDAFQHATGIMANFHKFEDEVVSPESHHHGAQPEFYAKRMECVAKPFGLRA